MASLFDESADGRRLKERQAAVELRNKYLDLLDKEDNEQTYQRFIEENSSLIPLDFVQNHGISCDLVLSKMPFAADYKTDFFFLSKSSDDWHAVFVELEKPSSRFFSAGGDFSSDFRKARDQINDWMAYNNKPENLNALMTSVSAIRVPVSMTRNPTFCKYVLVYGRRSEYGNNDVRRGKIQALERSDFKIVSFDSLAENLHNKRSHTVGVRHNEYIDIISPSITEPLIFQYSDPASFRVTKEYRDKMATDTQGPLIRVDESFRHPFQYAAETIQTR